jgi:hypothetical protein
MGFDKYQRVSVQALRIFGMIRNELTRRDLLKRGLCCAAGASLGLHEPIAKAATLKPAKAKSVIQIWMWGGPAHTDTFDPKPDAGYDYCGPLDKAIPTNVDGIQLGQLLPNLAKQADKFSIIRSMTHGVNGHETASYLTQTGHEPGRLVYPSVGAVVSKLKGHDADYKGVVPPYVVLTEPQGRFSEAGFLGHKQKPFATGGDPNAPRFVVEGIVAEGVSDERQLARRDLLGSLDSLGKAMPNLPGFNEFDAAQDKAYDLMLGEARQLFDLSNEQETLRDRYGRNRFGQSCLMARRLVEEGVPYITINYKGWDTHKQHFEAMNRNLPQMDQAMAALFADLSDRGLLDSTIVWWTGEFGRTPKIKWEAPWNGGRGHFGKCFSSVLAGGGFSGGQVIGASDKRGEEVSERAVYPRDVIASVYEQLGIDPDGPLPNDKGLDLTLLPKQDSDKSRGVLKEIM